MCGDTAPGLCVSLSDISRLRGRAACRAVVVVTHEEVEWVAELAEVWQQLQQLRLLLQSV